MLILFNRHTVIVLQLLQICQCRKVLFQMTSSKLLLILLPKPKSRKTWTK